MVFKAEGSCSSVPEHVLCYFFHNYLPPISLFSSCNSCQSDVGLLCLIFQTFSPFFNISTSLPFCTTLGAFLLLFNYFAKHFISTTRLLMFKNCFIVSDCSPFSLCVCNVLHNLFSWFAFLFIFSSSCWAISSHIFWILPVHSYLKEHKNWSKIIDMGTSYVEQATSYVD